jgi:hypothetical protein
MKSSLVVVLALLAIGCGSDDGSPADPPNSAPEGPPPGSTRYTLTTEPFTVGAGEEAYKCQTFANPFSGDVAVVRSESRMTAGSHHMHVFFNEDVAPGPIEDCSGLEFARTLHSSQSPEQVMRYPQGVGRTVKAHELLRIQSHYLNSSTGAVTAQITLDLYALPVDAIEQQAGSLFLSNFDIDVAPLSEGSVTRTCPVDQDINVLGLVSHMHQHATQFTAGTDGGLMLYASNDWNEPEQRVFRPALTIGAGSQITFTCAYSNQTAERLTFGESARNNEMCVLAGTYYPAPDGALFVCPR